MVSFSASKARLAATLQKMFQMFKSLFQKSKNDEKYTLQQGTRH